MPLKQYELAGDVLHLDEALRVQWPSFLALEAEMTAFTPRTPEDFQAAREVELRRLATLNPTTSTEDLAQFLAERFAITARPEIQFATEFSGRLTAQLVTVVVLSHALSEALINAILAIGLANAESADLFELLDRSDFLLKWRHGPKSFHSSYRFPCGTALDETLRALNTNRNALAHPKITLKASGETLLPGKQFNRLSLQTELQWVRRYFSAPYDLANEVRRQIREPFIALLLDRRPIAECLVHHAPIS